MTNRVVILGGGTGGTLAANRLRRRFARDDLSITVVDQDDRHVYQPGLLFVPFGLAHVEDIVRPRHRVQLTYVTPLDGAFTKPVASKQLGGMLADRGIDLVTEFNTGAVDGTGGRLVSYDDREVSFDLAVVVPLHGGAEYVGRSSGLGDELGFVPVDPHTLQAKVKPNVFALGDATDVPASKAGSVAHFEGEVLAGNVQRFLAGEPLAASFDGHTNCFIETGGGRALLIDFNYDTEPLTGHYPGPFGLPLLRPSRLNHLGKLAFQPLYWHGLLPGRDIPGISPPMPARGKSRS